MADKTYTKLQVIRNVPGFIVNSYDGTNYDIDIIFPEGIEELYEDKVITNPYEFFERATCECPPVKMNRKTYRCRLKGIKTNNKVKSDPDLMKKISNDVLNFKNRCNGWVFLNIGDIDVFKRMLVEMFDPISGESLNQVLLNPDFKDMYTIYHPPNTDGKSFLSLQFKGDQSSKPKNKSVWNGSNFLRNNSYPCTYDSKNFKSYGNFRTKTS